MKKIAILSVLSMVLLAGAFLLQAYDASASYWKIIPECIYAPATGGGTWVTEIQITSMASTAATVNAYFYYGGGLFRGPLTLTTGLVQYNSVKFSNILETLDSLDSGAFTYYGRVGSVWFFTSDTASAIQVVAKTVNGNYGKTFPGLNVVAANTAAVGRNLVIENLTSNATYRTFTGFFNTSSTATYMVAFNIIDSSNSSIGSTFFKTFAPYEYMTFNPFVEAGATSGGYDNCWLFIFPVSGGSDVRGIMGFGSIANNYSNDPAALLTFPFHVDATTTGSLLTDPQF